MKETIFIVADDNNFLTTHNKVLSESFNVFGICNLDDLGCAIDAEKPKSLLLNISSFNDSLVELCQTIISDQNYSPEIIIIADQSIDQAILQSYYEVGVSDQLSQTCQSSELIAKLTLSVARKNRESSLLTEVKESQNMVFDTMKQASQYSLVMAFFKNVALCSSLEQLAECFFETMNALELSATLRFNLPTVTYYHPDNKAVPLIEQNVYEALVDKGRLFEFKNRLIVNDNNVSFLVKNIPNDEAELGLLRDYCAALVEGLEAKVVELNTQRGIDNAAFELGASINNLKDWIKEQNFIVNSAMSEMMMEIATSYHELDMTDVQENFLTSLIEKTTESISRAEIHLVNVSQELDEVNNSMAVITSSFKKPTLAPDLDIELF